MEYRDSGTLHRLGDPDDVQNRDLLRLFDPLRRDSVFRFGGITFDAVEIPPILALGVFHADTDLVAALDDIELHAPALRHIHRVRPELSLRAVHPDRDLAAFEFEHPRAA